MENKINIAEILHDMPKGTKLYSPIFGEVKFYGFQENRVSILSTSNDKRDTVYNFTKSGSFYLGYSQSECLLFPSSKMRDWTKFFKRGDVVYSKAGKIFAIFEGWVNDDYTEFNTTINFYVDDASYGKEEICYTNCFVKASDEERATFIANAEKHYNGKYNPDTLQVEPVKPECPFKPFDKVLVRDAEGLEWYANYFSHYREYDQGYPYACMGVYYRYCIPYEGNEHLLGTTEPYTEGGDK